MAEREPISHNVRQAILKAHKHTCQYCLEAEADQVDHIVPVACGGTNDLGNLIASCQRCNYRKRAGKIHERYLALISAVADDKRHKVQKVLAEWQRERRLDAERRSRKPAKVGEIVLTNKFGTKTWAIAQTKRPTMDQAQAYMQAVRDMLHEDALMYEAAREQYGELTPYLAQWEHHTKHALDVLERHNGQTG